MEQAEKQKESSEDYIQRYLTQGPYVYELYSVLIHSGSAFGGHYYAYVKSFEDEKWYNFNDSTVTELDEEELQKVYGGSATSGYMLLYRKYGSVKKASSEHGPYKITLQDAPQEIIEKVEMERHRMIEEQQRLEKKSRELTTRIYIDKDTSKNHILDKSISYGANLRAVLRTLNNEASEEESKNGENKEDDSFDDLKDRVRLRAYDACLHVKMQVYDTYEHTPEKLKIFPYQVLYLEQRTEENAPFEVYNNDLVHVRVVKFVEGTNYDLDRVDTFNPVIMAFDKKKETVGEMEEKIAETLGMDRELLIILLKHDNILNDEVRTEFFNMDWRRKQGIGESS